MNVMATYLLAMLKPPAALRIDYSHVHKAKELVLVVLFEYYDKVRQVMLQHELVVDVDSPIQHW